MAYGRRMSNRRNLSRSDRPSHRAANYPVRSRRHSLPNLLMTMLSAFENWHGRVSERWRTAIHRSQAPDLRGLTAHYVPGAPRHSDAP